MRATTLLAGVSAVALMVLPTAALSAGVDEEGADYVRQGIQSWLEEYLLSDPTMPIELQGDVMVEPAGDGYDIALPPMFFQSPGPSITIDPIEAVAVPLDNGWFEAEWTIPSQYDFLMGQESVAQMTIANQTGEGLFAPEYQTMLDMEWILEGIEAGPTDGSTPGGLTLDTISVISDSEETDSGVYDTDFEIIVAGLEFDPGLSGGVTIDEIAVVGSADAMRMAENAAFGQEVNRLVNDLGPQGYGGADPAFFTEMAALLRNTPKLIGDLEATYRVHGIEASDGVEAFSLNNAGVTVFADGLDGESSTVGFRIFMDDVSLTPEPPLSSLIPNEVNGEVDLVDLPNDRLLELLITALDTAGQVGPDGAAAMAALELQQAIMAAGSRIEIPEFYIDTDVSDFEMTGSMRPDPAAALGIVADASMSISNMEGLIAELQTLPEATPAVQMLTLLQTMGAQATADDGSSLRTYDLEVTQAGQVMLNGNDMGPIFGQFMQ